ncbi:MAG: NERD domain-containing protein [Actinomycetota bacterium]|nr:NERD domain-containing protein [Actinomycetota bacterium]
MGSSYLTEQIVRRRIVFVRKMWWRLLIAALCLAALALVVAHITSGAKIPFSTVAFLPLLLLVLAPETVDGTYNQIKGRDAERWTAKELKKLRSFGWFVDGPIRFDTYDVDHVAVGPGGVLAIETKSTDSDRVSDFVLSGWVAQARRGARSIRLLLQHNYGSVAEVTPIVAVSARADVNLPPSFDGVSVIRIREVRDRIKNASSCGVLEQNTAREMFAALQHFKLVRSEAVA